MDDTSIRVSVGLTHFVILTFPAIAIIFSQLLPILDDLVDESEQRKYKLYALATTALSYLCLYIGGVLSLGVMDGESGGIVNTVHVLSASEALSLALNFVQMGFGLFVLGLLLISASAGWRIYLQHKLSKLSEESGQQK